MVFNATYNNISAILWQSISLVKKTVVPRENNQSAESNRQILSQNYIYIKKMNIKFSPTLTYLYILSLAGFVRMDFSEQYCIKGKA